MLNQLVFHLMLEWKSIHLLLLIQEQVEFHQMMLLDLILVQMDFGIHIVHI